MTRNQALERHIKLINDIQQLVDDYWQDMRQTDKGKGLESKIGPVYISDWLLLMCGRSQDPERGTSTTVHAEALNQNPLTSLGLATEYSKQFRAHGRA